MSRIKKRTSLGLVFFLFAFSLFAINPDFEFKRKLFHVTLKGHLLQSPDDNYSDMYGADQYAPEIKFGIRISGHLYSWAGYGLITAKGQWLEWSHKSLIDPDLRWEIKSQKHAFSLGIGYYVGLDEPGEFSIKSEVGVCFVINQEDARNYQIDTGTEVDSSSESVNSIGITGELGVLYGLLSNLYAEISVGYLYARETIDDVKILLGGLKFSAGLGFRF
jgi:hypothetical protein